MTRQNQAAETKSDKKSQPKVKRTVVEERSDDLAGLAKLPGGPIAVVGGGTIQAQAARLGDPHWQTAQRQALAAQIGRVQGNRHLQRVMAQIGQDAQSPTSLVDTHSQGMACDICGFQINGQRLELDYDRTVFAWFNTRNRIRGANQTYQEAMSNLARRMPAHFGQILGPEYAPDHENHFHVQLRGTQETHGLMGPRSS